jgi:catechol 2,3-dioxygenase-like lactoylglutathione lyase family enzyme
MPLESPIWPAQLDHLRLNTPDPAGLEHFYCHALGLEAAPLPDGTRLLQGPERRLVLGAGLAGERPYHGFRVRSREQLERIRRFVDDRQIPAEPSPSSVFEPDAVAVRDPDGWLVVFGIPRAELPTPKARNDRTANALPARLQHVVVASDDLPRMIDFYENTRGFVPSDYCAEDPEHEKTRKVAFYRTDPEHHSFAVFAASSVRADHHAYETTCWNDIRDWADHLASLEIKIWWGPGRHGPGNNLFLMVEDPHGHAVELSAELEHLPRYAAPRIWPHDERSLNLWGPGWMRD